PASAPGSKIINRLVVNMPVQVNLRVRVAEINRNIDKHLGFRWDIAGKLGGIALGIATANPFISSVTQHTGTVANTQLGWDLNAVIDALEEEGLIKVLAEPNLTALSGETAEFLAGGEFPVVYPKDQDSAYLEFKTFGVALAFTPTILDQSRINLKVAPEVSELTTENSISYGGFVIPSLTTRRAQTTVELGSGQSLAIAGLIKNNTDHSLSKFPGLGDIPILGALFRSDRFQRQESELVIIVTPYIVRPVSGQKLATPDQGYAAPHDVERLFVGGLFRRNSEKGAGGPVERRGRGLIGPIGFEYN
ncbi:MAG: type II and III secretion system protein family protein, partial [Rhodospirillales bacterium]|nr:type II and III secretion system protein family protein [Rhodospirillales bacterium]